MALLSQIKDKILFSPEMDIVSQNMQGILGIAFIVLSMSSLAELYIFWPTVNIFGKISKITFILLFGTWGLVSLRAHYQQKQQEAALSAADLNEILNDGTKTKSKSRSKGRNNVPT